jgi:hypothetical protein
MKNSFLLYNLYNLNISKKIPKDSFLQEDAGTHTLIATLFVAVAFEERGGLLPDDGGDFRGVFDLDAEDFDLLELHEGGSWECPTSVSALSLHRGKAEVLTNRVTPMGFDEPLEADGTHVAFASEDGGDAFEVRDGVDLGVGVEIADSLDVTDHNAAIGRMVGEVREGLGCVSLGL